MDKKKLSSSIFAVVIAGSISLVFTKVAAKALSEAIYEVANGIKY